MVNTAGNSQPFWFVNRRHFCDGSISARLISITGRLQWFSTDGIPRLHLHGNCGVYGVDPAASYSLSRRPFSMLGLSGPRICAAQHLTLHCLQDDYECQGCRDQSRNQDLYDFTQAVSFGMFQKIRGGRQGMGHPLVHE